MEELVSIIVPVCNSGRHLAKTLDSILSQSWENIEVLCIPQNQDSLGTLEHYKEFDLRIKVMPADNPNDSYVRNVGINSATGKYLLFVDCGDRLSTVAVEKLVNNAEKNNSDVVIFDYIWQTEALGKYVFSNIREFKNYYQEKSFSIDTMGSLSYKLIPSQVWNKLYRTDFLKNGIRFNENVVFYNIPFWAEVYSKANMTYVPEAFYFYNMSENPLSKINDERVFDIVESYDLVEKILKKSGHWSKYKTSVEILMLVDCIFKFNTIRFESKEQFFNLLKSLKRKFDYKLYQSDSYSPSERMCAGLFELIGKNDFMTFCKIQDEVIRNV